MKKLLAVTTITYLLPFCLLAETTAPSSNQPVAGNSILSELFNLYPPREAKFSDNNDLSDSYSNERWLNMSLPERGEYIMNVATVLTAIHDFRYGPDFEYSPRVITCKVYRESTFHSQRGNDNSSAVGLSQVLDKTSEDLFDRYGDTFRSIVPGFENVRDGKPVPHAEGFNSKMAASIPAQLEMGLFVMHMKSLDNAARVRRGRGKPISSVKCLLENYFGSTSRIQNADGSTRRVPNHRRNKKYALPIFNCAVCLKANEDRAQNSGDEKIVTQECLDKAKTPPSKQQLDEDMNRRC